MLATGALDGRRRAAAWLEITVQPARTVLWKARRAALRVRPVHPEPYATHLPVLSAIASIHPTFQVLELGSGTFSTSLFLDRATFANLRGLVSYEDDADWAHLVRSATGDDERLDLRIVPAVTNSVPTDLSPFDLIFIDDSRTPAERSVTIRAVAAQQPAALVIVHDFEQRAYRRASRAFERRHVFKTFTPQCGVLWNGDAISAREVQRAKVAVEAGRSIPVQQVAAWRKHLSSLRVHDHVEK